MSANFRLKFTIFFFFIAGFFHIQAEIIETPNFSLLLDYVTKNPQANTLIILDIDDTLLIPTQTLGTDVWFGYRFSAYRKTGMSVDKALDKSLAEWEAIRHLTNVKTVECNTADIVKAIQEKGIAVIGLTTQGLALATRTKNQLNELHIDLNKTTPVKEDIYFINNERNNPQGTLIHTGTIANSTENRGVLYRDGILFTAGSNKATALVKLLKHFPKMPSRIIFINDKSTHLNDAANGAEELGIPFIGLRYSYSDERIKNFRTDIAEIQYNKSTFSHILSDEEALAIIESSNTCDSDLIRYQPQ